MLEQHTIRKYINNKFDVFLSSNNFSTELKSRFSLVNKKILEKYDRPFFEWKISEEEFDIIKEVLIKSTKEDLEKNEWQLLFCIYGSECIKYKYRNHLNWELITSDISKLQNHKSTKLSDYVKNTFKHKYWGRPEDLIESKSLWTLAGEAGLPIKSLTVDVYQRYFKNLIHNEPVAQTTKVGVADAYKTEKNKNIWKNIAIELMGKNIESLNKEEKIELSGDNFYYHTVQKETLEFLKQKKKEYQAQTFKVDFHIKISDGKYELHKKIKFPNKLPNFLGNINIHYKKKDGSEETREVGIMDEFGEGKNKDFGWYSKPMEFSFDNNYCLGEIGISNSNSDYNYICLGDSTFSLKQCIDLTNNVVFFVADKKDEKKYNWVANKFYRIKAEDGDVYAIFPNNLLPKSEKELGNIIDIFDGYKLIKINSDIKFYQSDIKVGGIVDEYSDVDENNSVEIQKIFKENIKFGSQNYPVYKGIPKFLIRGATTTPTHFRKIGDPEWTEIANNEIIGSKELGCIKENVLLYSLKCIIFPIDYDFNGIKIEEKYFEFPFNNKLIYELNGEKKEYIEAEREQEEKIGIQIYFSEQEKLKVDILPMLDKPIFYNGKDQIIEKNITFYDINRGAYLKVGKSEITIKIGQSITSEKKLLKNNQYYLSNYIDEIKKNMLIGYKSETTINLDIYQGEADKNFQTIDVSLYNLKLKVNDADNIVIQNITEKNNLNDKDAEEDYQIQFVSLKTGDIYELDPLANTQNVEYTTSKIKDGDLGIIFDAKNNSTKSCFINKENMNKEVDVNGSTLKDIVIYSTNRNIHIPKKYKDMIENPGQYGEDFSYLEKFISMADKDIPIEEIDIFKSFNRCPNFVIELYIKYRENEKITSNIKKILKKINFMPELYSFASIQKYLKNMDNKPVIGDEPEKPEYMGNMSTYNKRKNVYDEERKEYNKKLQEYSGDMLRWIEKSYLNLNPSNKFDNNFLSKIYEKGNKTFSEIEELQRQGLKPNGLYRSNIFYNVLSENDKRYFDNFVISLVQEEKQKTYNSDEELIALKEIFEKKVQDSEYTYRQSNNKYGKYDEKVKNLTYIDVLKELL